MHSAWAVLCGWTEGGSEPGQGSDAPQPADDSCATGGAGTSKESVPEQTGPVLWWPCMPRASIPAAPAFLEKTRAWELHPPATLCLYRSPQMPLNLTILGARKYNVTEKASPTEM